MTKNAAVIVLCVLALSGLVLGCASPLGPSMPLPSTASAKGNSTAMPSPGIPWIWGDNPTGQLGVGNGVANSDVPLQVGLDEVNAISAGYFHSLALQPDGTLWAWGDNSEGQLGVPVVYSDLPVPVTGLSGGVVAIAAGGFHSLAVKSDGTVWAWGLNNFGQLGDGTTTNSDVPVEISTPARLAGVRFKTVAAAYGYSLALDSHGRVWEWGDANGVRSTVPIWVNSLPPEITAIAASAEYWLALSSDGQIWAEGNNQYGELGNGSTSSSSVPVRVSELSGVVAIAADTGGTFHSLALESNGTVWAWGVNYCGELGDGITGGYSDVPVQVRGLEAKAIAAGGEDSFAIDSNGTVWAWGISDDGQLGDGASSNSNVPMQVRGITGAVAIATGMAQAMAITPVVQTITSILLAASPSRVIESTNPSSTITAVVLDQNGQPIRGVAVHFASAGTVTGGNLNPLSGSTNAHGEASTSLIANVSSTGNLAITVTASAGGIHSTIDITFLAK